MPTGEGGAPNRAGAVAPAPRSATGATRWAYSESVSPLLELSAFVDGHEALAEDARESESLDADALDALASRRASDAASRLGAYLHAAESALERASRNASPDGDGRRAPQGGVSRFLSRAGAGGGAHRRRRPGGGARGGRGRGRPRAPRRAPVDGGDRRRPRGGGSRRRDGGARRARGAGRRRRAERVLRAAEAADLGMQAAETAASDDAEAAANRAPHAAARLALAALPALEHIAEDEAEPLAARLVATVLTSAASATAAADFEAFQSDAERVATENWLQRGIQDVRDASARGRNGAVLSRAARRSAPAARRRRRGWRRRRAAWTRTSISIFVARTRRRARFPRRRAR